MIKLLFALLALSFHAWATVDQPNQSDNEFVMPGEFCNADSNNKQKALLDHYPHDTGIINLYALYLGLCQMVHVGQITEQAASQQWQAERDKLIHSRK